MNFEFGFSALPLASEVAVQALLQPSAEADFQKWQASSRQQIERSEERVEAVFERHHGRFRQVSDALVDSFVHKLASGLWSERDEAAFDQQLQVAEQILLLEEQQLKDIVDGEASEQTRSVRVAAQAVQDQFLAVESEIAILAKRLDALRNEELHLAALSKDKHELLAAQQVAEHQFLRDKKEIDLQEAKDRMGAEHKKREQEGRQQAQRREQEIRKLELETDKEKIRGEMDRLHQDYTRVLEDRESLIRALKQRASATKKGLKKRNKALVKSVHDLEADNSDLRQAVGDLESQKMELETRSSTLEKETKDLKSKNTSLEKAKTTLKDRGEKLRKKNTSLTARLKNKEKPVFLVSLRTKKE